MKSIRRLLTLAIIVYAMNANSQTFNYDFSSGYEGWMGDFADYYVTDSLDYELEFIRTTLPTPLSTSKYALKISGRNNSDDLFMFIKRKISGLLPNTTYQLKIDVEFASNAPTNAVGVGGAPGEGVTMKAGASTLEPLKINTNGYYVMNIDKGNQSQPGVDMDTIGHVGVSDTTTQFTLIENSNDSHVFTIPTDANGETWVCIGTESGFESTTTLYYNMIALTFFTTSGLDNHPNAANLNIYPNPTNDLLTINVSKNTIGSTFIIFDQTGRQVMTGKLNTEATTVDFSKFTTGVYLVQVGQKSKQTFKLIKK